MTDYKPQKFGLTRISEDGQPRLEPHIKIKDPEKSFHTLYRVTEKDGFDNRPIFGNNLCT